MTEKPSEPEHVRTDESQKSAEPEPSGRSGARMRLLIALVAVFGVVLAFGLMRFGKLTGMGAGKRVQCKAVYTTCVLDCNKKSVRYSQKIQNSLSPKARQKWQRQLEQAQTQCIPMCYQLHCLGRTPKAAAAALKARKAR